MRRLLAVLLAAFALVMLGATAAGAAPWDCTDAPPPEVPGRGLTGFFESEPKPLPPDEDPFDPKSSTTIYEQYGYAGLRWHTYDLGCGPDAARSPDAVAGTALANWVYLFPKVAVAFTNSVVEVAFQPTFLNVFDPLVRNVSDTLYRTIFTQWIPLVLLAAGFVMIWRARRADLASSTAAVGWAIVIMVLATALFQWPVEAGRVADASVTTTLNAVNGGLSSTGKSENADGSKKSANTVAASNIHDVILYRAWLAGTFGQANSDTARIYGPRLFDASALTWREARTLRENPERGKQIIEEKKAAYEEVAQQVKESDPDAYEYLTGRRSDTRVGFAALAAFEALCAIPFLLGSALLVLAAFMIVRFAVMLFPAFATLGVFPAMRGVVTAVGNTVAAAVINAVLFGIAAAVTLRAIGLLLDPSSALQPWLAATVMLLFSIAMWLATRPLRRLTTMVHVRRVDEDSSVLAAAGAWGLTRRFGRRSQPKHARRRTRDDEAVRAESAERVRAETHSMPELQPSAGLPAAGPTYGLLAQRYPTTGPGGAAPSGAVNGSGPQRPGPNGRAEYRAADEPARPGGLSQRQRAQREARREIAHSEGETDQRELEQRTQNRSEARAEARRNAAPARVAAGGDGASIPIAARGVAEEGGGHIYVPDRARPRATPGNGRRSVNGPRQPLEEFFVSTYRPDPAPEDK